jgi:leucyl-tRNA synthetase
VSKDGSLYELKEAYIDKEDGVSVNSGRFSGMKTPDAIKEITAWLETLGKGKKAVNYKLRDWIFSSRDTVESLTLSYDVQTAEFFLNRSNSPLHFQRFKLITHMNRGVATCND